MQFANRFYNRIVYNRDIKKSRRPKMKRIINELVNFNLTMAIASFFGTFILLLIDIMVGVFFFGKFGIYVAIIFIILAIIRVVFKK